MKAVTYKGRKQNVTAGPGFPVRINLSIGLTDRSVKALKNEREKIARISKHCTLPDMMMDLSVRKTNPELWEILRDAFGGPIGILPHYLLFEQKSGIDSNKLLRRIDQLMRAGIGFITIHASPNMDLLRRAAKTRGIPLTSRGGGVVVRDMLINRRDTNIYAQHFDEIADMAARYGVVLNLGTSFRSANVSDGLDSVATAELRIQHRLIERAQNMGASVCLEGPGHLSFPDINKYVRITKSFRVPLMPLGPIATDLHPKIDHIVNAIGAAYMMAKTRGGIINCITRVEHRGGVPTAKQLLEALDAAKAAAHMATASYDRRARAMEDDCGKQRSATKKCIVLKKEPLNGRRECKRCGPLCPLKIPVLTQRY